MGKLFLVLLLPNILSVIAFKTQSCDHDQVVKAVTDYNKCTAEAIKSTVGSLAMMAGDEVDENAVDKTCELLKRDGPIMTCAKENMGNCFETQNLEFNLKLAGQHAVSVVCSHEDDTQINVEDDIFFAWLELDDISPDTDCDVEAMDQTNIHFQKCILEQDESLIQDTKDVKKAKQTATNALMKCFDETENTCFSDKEMTFLRKEFLETIDSMMTMMFGMGDLNIDDTTKTPETIGAIKDDGRNSSGSRMINLSLFITVIFFSL